MTLEELRSERRDEILRLAAKRGARNARVFGSVARGADYDRSDVDFLFDLSGLLIDLEALETQAPSKRWTWERKPR